MNIVVAWIYLKSLELLLMKLKESNFENEAMFKYRTRISAVTAF